MTIPDIFDPLGLFKKRPETPTTPAPPASPPVPTVDLGDKLQKLYELQQTTNDLLTAILNQLSEQVQWSTLSQPESQVEPNSLAYLRYPRILFDAEHNKYFKVTKMYINEIGPTVVLAGGVQTMTIAFTASIPFAYARLRWYALEPITWVVTLEPWLNGISMFAYRDSNAWTVTNARARVLQGERILNFLELGVLPPILLAGSTNVLSFVIMNAGGTNVTVGVTLDQLALEEISPEDAKNFRRL